MKGCGRYILNAAGEPEECEDLHRWGRWFGAIHNRTVAKTTMPDGARVSTVFLGMDHSFGDDATPVLWETMIFDGPHDGYQERYTSQADAEAGHEFAVAVASGKVPP